MLESDLKPTLKRWADAEKHTPPVRAPYKELPQLKFVRALVAEGHNDLFLTGDTHQRIYGQPLRMSRRRNLDPGGLHVGQRLYGHSALLASITAVWSTTSQSLRSAT